MLVILDGYTGYSDHSDYRLYIEPSADFTSSLVQRKELMQNVECSYYLYLLLVHALQNRNDILVVNPIN